MASRPVVPTHARGEAVIGGGGAKQWQPQKKNGGADARNRKALGDIGNLVTVRGVDTKLQNQINRPITRSFGAQLLAKAQAAAAAENNKKAAVTKAKPPKEVIEISPDTEKEAKANTKHSSKEDEAVNKRKDGEGSSRRNKNRTLTSVLTARSKAACGISNKPKEPIVDIDAADANNELAAVDYIEDLYQFYKEAESENRPIDYMPSQPEITEKMRTILVDWLVDIHRKFDLQPETLYLAINIVDRFLSVKPVPRKELQLLGMGALFTASKYEEIWAPQVNEVVCIADGAYSDQQVLAMEKTILGELEWYLTVPTQYVFLVRFIKAAIADTRLENMVYFLAELGLMNYSTLSYPPSLIAASAVYAARCTLNTVPFWTATLKVHTGYSEAQIMDCAKLLVGFHFRAKDSKFNVVYRKYSSSEKEAVALLSPAKALLDEGSVKTSSMS